MFVKGVANATPFFFVIVFRVIVQTDLVCLVCEGSCKCKKKRPCFLGQGLLVTTTSRYAALIGTHSTVSDCVPRLSVSKSVSEPLITI